jgi:hypothetical protein
MSIVAGARADEKWLNRAWKYIITKSLMKVPEDYPNAKSQPHVQVRFTRFFSFHLVMVREIIV